MLFIHPMWLHESQRIGKKRCTPAGYSMHVIAELIGFAGLLLLFVSPMFLGWRFFAGSFRTSNLWIMVVVFGFGIVSEALFQFSWWFAKKKNFHFDYERSEASWVESGERRTYKYPE